MDSLRVPYTGQCGLIKIFIALIILPTAFTAYSIGVGIADTTGPTAEVVFMGYASIKQKGTGLHLRTFSRAFIIDDGEERFVFVSVDSAMISYGVKKEIIERLKLKFGDLYTEGNVMISGTHTHSSPGGFMMDVLFDLTIFGFVKQTFFALVNGITNSIESAHNAVVPGRILISQGEILGANINRSPQAYMNNPESEREKYQHDVDKTMTQLHLIGANNQPLGAISWFAVHPTSMNNTNRLVSSDNVGYASILLEQEMNKGALIGKGPFVSAFASSNLGDVSPNTRGPKCEFSGNPCTEQYTCSGKKERCFSSGPGRDMFESTSIIAHKLYEKSLDLWQNGNKTEVKGPIRIVHRFVDMTKQKANFFNETSKKVEEIKGCYPAMGYSFAAGTTDGPGSFAFEQGTITPNPFWNMVRNFIAAPTDDDIHCHGMKPILLATGRMILPYQWQPNVVSTHLAMIGNVAIAGVPGEFTTMSGRRLRNVVKETIEESGMEENPIVVVAGLCNTYTDYITTPEEYQVQRYEGASTIYGPHTLTIYLQQYKELTEAALKGTPLDPGPSPKDLRKTSLISLVPPVLYDTPEWGKEFGDCLQQPSKFVRPGDVVTVSFISGHPRNNLMTEKSFLTIEKLEDDEIWSTVATDANWETKFIWSRKSIMLGSSTVTIIWNVPENVEPGEYRIRHNGYYRYILGGVYPYQGITNHFQVISSNNYL
ncbi:neutral ceramidase [Leptopilina heterotoma]|uniref:neutral ceramidase n=1 Tax=Leptopilina heterotoma TaxID=63436 RepID=UPI001CA8D83D|nr:neutral ceramidase [Leptopilina heterotoma]XP_043460809.1 neutral ceramidase [Leptopilina heterotoma]XP_043460812.1 neutral ceramidase [Leptopilina heterotoma]XP_043460817.1 neutral ceramidase [Leptopilina heterotoma]